MLLLERNSDRQSKPADGKAFFLFGFHIIFPAEIDQVPTPLILPPRSSGLRVHQRVGVRRKNELVGSFARTGTRLPVPDQNGHRHPSGRRQGVATVVFDVQSFFLLSPLCLVTVVLKPDLHLSRR